MKKSVIPILVMCLLCSTLAGCAGQETPVGTAEVTRGDLTISVPVAEGPLREESVIYVEEYLHGKLHKLKLRITKIEPNSRIEYKCEVWI